jgi:hypothetical protein
VDDELTGNYVLTFSGGLGGCCSEVGFDEIAADLPEACFSTTSGLPTNRPNGTHLTQAAAARRTKNFACEIVLSSEFRKG